MIFLGSVSGIQDYVFDLPATGGGQARMLRSRSARVQIIVECAAQSILLQAQGSPAGQSLLCAAGKFALSLPDVAKESANAVAAEIQRWVFSATGGRLRFSFATGHGAKAAAAYIDALQHLAKEKYSPFRHSACPGGTWQSGALCIPETTGWGKAEEDRAFGRILSESDYIFFSPTNGASRGPRSVTNLPGFDASAGIAATRPAEAAAFCRLNPDLPPLPGLVEFQSPLAWVPRESNGRPLEFSEIAARSTGAPMLGVLKADVDGLGSAVRRLLGGADDLRPLVALSARLNDFFTRGLRKRLETQWQSIYCVFAGGDDMLVVGPWSAMLPFAGEISRAFSSAFQDQRLTLSAGLAIGRYSRPIRSLAAEAEDALHLAKTVAAPGSPVAKDQICAFGEIWKWKDHASLLRSADSLFGWVRDGHVTRASVRGVFDLVSPANRSKPEFLAMAPARLAYHIARNFKSDTPHRQWAERVARGLGQNDQKNLDSTHIKTVLRYAMLASRQRGESE